MVDNVHLQFVNAVAAGRKLPREDVLKIADGRIFTGEQAKALGLVDALGNLEDTVADAAKAGGDLRGAEGRDASEEQDLPAGYPPGRDALHDRWKDGRESASLELICR